MAVNVELADSVDDDDLVSVITNVAEIVGEVLVTSRARWTHQGVDSATLESYFHARTLHSDPQAPSGRLPIVDLTTPHR
jgi:hypothetical protein